MTVEFTVFYHHGLTELAAASQRYRLWEFLCDGTWAFVQGSLIFASVCFQGHSHFQHFALQI
jgi:hypothetical protein